MQSCFYFSMRIWICSSTWRLMRFCQMKSSIRKWARVYFSSRSASPVSDAYSGMHNTSRAPPKFGRNKMQAKIKSWYVCLCIADALHEALDLSQGVPTFGKFAEGWCFHQSPWGITLREHSAKTTEVNVQTPWETTGCFVSRGVTWMHYWAFFQNS